MRGAIPLERERELIRTFRESGPAAALGLTNPFIDLDVAAADQMEAATAETRAKTPLFQAALGMPHSLVSGRSPETEALVLAAIVRCLHRDRSCGHVESGGVPLLAMLASRVCSCGPCMPLFEDLIEEADVANRGNVGRGRLCDLCLEEPDPFWFRPWSVTLGPARIMGDICDPCAALFGIPARDA